MVLLLLFQLVNLSEVLVPLAMMFGLSLVHSQIVSPNSSVNHCPTNKKGRRTKRSKRRSAPPSRYRSSLGKLPKSLANPNPASPNIRLIWTGLGKIPSLFDFLWQDKIKTKLVFLLIISTKQLEMNLTRILH